VAGQGKTIVFFPEGAFGPTNNCVGIGSILKARGHRVVFVVEESFAGTLEVRGFEEVHMRLQPDTQAQEEPGQFWKDFIRDTAPQFRRPTIEQLEGFLKPTWQALIDGAIHVDGRLQEIFDEVRPDVIVEDNVVAFAALSTSRIPWVRITTCNPLEWKDPDIPPVFSGYPSNDRTGWLEFWAEYDRVLGPQIAEFDAWLQERGGPALPSGGRDYIWTSPWLNLFVYPEQVDYRRRDPYPPTVHRLGSSVRDTDTPFEVHRSFINGKGGLIYLSLGSLGAADVELMRRLIDVLARTPHRYVVSTGPQHERFDLAENMWGEEFVPQVSILPKADLVITHGGNNTVTECFHFGKPMIVLPLFWDQYDNAQRVRELRFGERLPTYAFEEDDLTGAIHRLLTDEGCRERMAALASRLQAAPGTVRAADLIERLARDGQSVHR
jgi:MGT family glycosyltransferase